jgi:hypothetical protein
MWKPPLPDCRFRLTERSAACVRRVHIVDEQYVAKRPQLATGAAIDKVTLVDDSATFVPSEGCWGAPELCGT